MEDYTPENEKERFEALYRLEYEGLCRYAASIFQGSGACISGRVEEAVQEVFALAWEKRRNLFSSASPTGWLYKALYYKIKEMLAEDRRWSKRLMQAASQAQTQESEHTLEDVELNTILSEERYQTLALRYFDGLSYREICERLGLSKSALAMRINRGKQRLLKELGIESD